MAVDALSDPVSRPGAPRRVPTPEIAEPTMRETKRTLPVPRPIVDGLFAVTARPSASPGSAQAASGTSPASSSPPSPAALIDPRDRSVQWAQFLERAVVRPARLHDARHTAATLLLGQGVDERMAIDMLGWTSPTMTARQQHVVPKLVEEANRRMSELLWRTGRTTSR